MLATVSRRVWSDKWSPQLTSFACGDTAGTACTAETRSCDFVRTRLHAYVLLVFLACLLIVSIVILLLPRNE
jgi:hypothetical protein